MRIGLGFAQGRAYVAEQLHAFRANWLLANVTRLDSNFAVLAATGLVFCVAVWARFSR